MVCFARIFFCLRRALLILCVWGYLGTYKDEISQFLGNGSVFLFTQMLYNIFNI